MIQSFNEDGKYCGDNVDNQDRVRDGGNLHEKAKSINCSYQEYNKKDKYNDVDCGEDNKQ